MVYLPEAMALLRNGGKLRHYATFAPRVFVTEVIGEGFTLTHEVAPSASNWLLRNESVWQELV